MKAFKYIIVLLLLLIAVSGNAQFSEKYNSKYAGFYRAEELYDKQKYSAAQEEYKTFMTQIADINDPFYVKAKYYHAICALNLFHPDSEKLLLTFIEDYPETVHRDKIYFELGKHYYTRKRFEETIAWFGKIDEFDLEEEYKPEYYFKLGYAYFSEDELKLGRNAFHEILNIESSYQNPALYYYSHISYLEKNYQVALNGFEKLKADPSFAETVPYYITQIYYLQGKYDKVVTYAPIAAQNKNETQNLEMSKLIGDAFYKIGKYDEAVPFLETYNNKSATTRDEDYQLGYAYLKSGNYEKAIPVLDKVTDTKDELSQVAFYHIAECYLKLEKLVPARDAFERATRLSFDKEIEEDALYNYALLSYKIDYNPFNEAVEAMTLYLDKYPDSKHQQEIYQYLINVYSTMKNYKAAITFMDKIENKNFQIKSAYQMMAYNYGVELFQSGKNPEAIDAFELVRVYPINNKMNAQSLYWIAEVYYKTSDYPNAIKNYRSFLEEAGGYELPFHNSAYYNIGYAYFKQADNDEAKFEDAIRSFRTFTLDKNETNKVKLTDAFLRIGDAYFKSKNDDNALIYYQKAIDQGGGQADYAKFQMGMSHGYKDSNATKAEVMLAIVQNNPSSTFAVKALFEAGEAYRLIDGIDNQKPIKLYEQLIRDYPDNILVKDAIFQIGILEFNSKNYRKAETQFLKILNEYDDEAKQREALSQLKDVYSALGQPEKYIALVESRPGTSIGDTEKDELFFTSAYDLYQDTLWAKSIDAFNKYLSTFSNPIHELESQYLVARCYLKLKNEDGATKAYKQILTKGSNRFTEEAALFVSEKEYEQENYELAIVNYLKLLEVSTFPKNTLIAHIGLMRSYAFQKEFNGGKPHAEKVLLDESALDFVKTEAHYVIGMAHMDQQEFTTAVTHFEHVADNSKAEIGAESQYHLALILNIQEEYNKSELAVRKLIKNHGGYSYWRAKALILQSKNSIGLGDLVQAEYTLNSIINGYAITDDGILDEVNEVMQVLTAMKDRDKDINTNSDNTIEINEGGNDE